MAEKKQCAECSESFDFSDFMSFMLKPRSNTIFCVPCQTENYLFNSKSAGAATRLLIVILVIASCMYYKL